MSLRKVLTVSILAALVAAGGLIRSAAADSGLRVQYRTTATGGSAYEMQPWFKIANSGSAPVPLAELKIRYYFTGDGAAYTFSCAWAVPGCGNVTSRFVTLSAPVAGADRYLEIGFTSGSIPAGGDTGDIQLRVYRSDWQNVNQANDYSFGAQSGYADWAKTPLYRAGAPAWGTPAVTEPTGPPGTPTPTPTVPPGERTELFDDFSYTANNDSRIQARGWTVRTNAGGPGVPGASWPASNVTFPSIGTGNQALTLTATTNGTSAGTSQAELFHQRKFFEGTYAARVRFSDAPTSGPDGDQIVQTFFTITPLAFDLDPDYGEIDFEYLPNGGWGTGGPIMYATTWETYRNEPWLSDNTYTTTGQSMDGWHDLVVQVSGGNVTYFIDGQQFAQHGGRFYPETPMSINFNHWFISGGLGGSATPRSYVEQVDWVYHAKDEVVSPAVVQSRVTGFRTAGTAWKDDV
ncbi:hydrolase [Microtetraspora sp. NBRC 13810]|uniref:cellulose binding domain-containing protein n=1 Tax=Microtetraspora sp. NBRC 13810 TaxID=3030990 RepID=UPI0024A5A734|nr:cellulose binding domain-containing protein [Microtetraspora sp. NBRC 13810]GLW07999.1 hydrolase [Microtetraspora sp. NBRC 13810]